MSLTGSFISQRKLVLRCLFTALVIFFICNLSPRTSAAQDGVPMSIKAAEALVLAIFSDEQRSRYEDAASLYLGLLEVLEKEVTGDDRLILDRLFFELQLVLPDDIVHELCGTSYKDLRKTAGKDQLPSCSFPEGTDEMLIRWWRSQDPLPGTFTNERVYEHLRRTAYARENHSTHRRPEKIDDRGTTYIKYGAPDRSTVIEPWNDPWLFGIIQRNPSVQTSDFRRGEFWVYNRVDRNAHFLFVEENREYRFGDANDFVPPRLRGRHAMIFLNAMRVSLRSLALYHIDYSGRYNEIEDYMNRAVMGGTDMPPSSMALSVTSRNQMEDYDLARLRAEIPDQSSDVLRTFGQMLVQVRSARFLDEDGNTRVKLFWSHPPDAFRMDRRERRDFRRAHGDTEIQGVAVQFLSSITSEDYARRHIDSKNYRISRDDAGSGYPTQVLHTSVASVYTPFHIGAQWDGYAILEEGGELVLGPQIKQVTFRRDTLEELNRRGDIIEMSDLMPMFSDSHAMLDAQQGTPYPFGRITREIPIAIFFEVYHLEPDESGMASYTVSYDIVRKRDRDGFLRLRRHDPESVSAEYSTSVAGTRSDEFIELDLTGFQGEGTVEVIVTVTDDRTGQSVSRSVDFDYVEDVQFNQEVDLAELEDEEN